MLPESVVKVSRIPDPDHRPPRFINSFHRERRFPQMLRRLAVHPESRLYQRERRKWAIKPIGNAMLFAAIFKSGMPLRDAGSPFSVERESPRFVEQSVFCRGSRRIASDIKKEEERKRRILMHGGCMPHFLGVEERERESVSGFILFLAGPSLISEAT